jgi:hypothetical protein
MNATNLKTIEMPYVTTLEDHLVECENRFQDVVCKLDRLENRMDVIEDILIDIKSSLRKIVSQQP